MFNYRYSHLSCQCANVLKTPLHLRKNSFPPLHLVVLPPYSPKNLVKRKVSLQKGEVSPATENLSAKNCVYTFFFLLSCISGPSPLPLLDLLLKALHFLGNLYQRSHKILPIKPRNSLKHRLHTLVQRLPKRVCQRTASLFQVNDPRTAIVWIQGGREVPFLTQRVCHPADGGDRQGQPSCLQILLCVDFRIDRKANQHPQFVFGDMICCANLFQNTPVLLG